MVQLMERIYLQCRGMGILFWIPLIGYYIIVPSAGWILGQNPLEDREMLERVTEVSYRFIPLLSTWWMFLVHKEYIEGDGKEILYLGKNILGLTIGFFLLNIICCFPSVFLFNRPAERVLELFFQLTIIMFLTCGMAYFLNFSLKNISVYALVTMIFCTLSVVPSDRLFQYQFISLQGNELWLEEGVKFIISGGIFWIFGAISSRRFE